jgi:hypothetical protein
MRFASWVCSSIVAASVALPGTTHAVGGCPLTRPSDAYAARVRDATRAQRDLWGAALLRSRDGPTYDGAHRFLAPLLLAFGPGQRPLTRSGVYYLAFGMRPGDVALHVADGSAIVLNRTGGAELDIGVGRDGREPYGSCLARLAAPRLYRGYEPVLETDYVDADGARLHQESFATHVPQTRALVSFVRLTIDAPPGDPGQLRISPAPEFFSAGAGVDGTSLVYPLATTRTVTLARLVRPAPSAPIPLGDVAYDAARASVAAYWDRRLAAGTLFRVPEARVLDAERNLLIQNLLMGWRYSVGNAYESFEFPESLENAAVLGEYGFTADEEAIVRSSLQREPHLYQNWEAGMRLLAAARTYRLSRDASFLDAITAPLQRNAVHLERQLRDDALLSPERYAADLPDRVRGLPGQAVAWEGLRAIAEAWTGTGRRAAAAGAQTAAARLGRALRAAVARSQVRLPDGSLFLPARLLDDERPYAALTSTRHGSYWNLVIQDALASGLFAPGGREARGVLSYLSRHGARLLGLVRGGAYALYGRRTQAASGTDEVYGLNVARFLADNDRPDQLVLSLYGALAAAMTENTFVSGEGATVAPRRGAYDRAMYLPPNSTSNAAWLETLRLMLVHETADGLQIAYATPRSWLAAGKQIAVRRAPTAFGRLSFTITASARTVQVQLLIPAAVSSLSLRLRRPRGLRLTRVELNGRPYPNFSAAGETIDLHGHTGRLIITAHFAPAG